MQSRRCALRIPSRSCVVLSTAEVPLMGGTVGAQVSFDANTPTPPRGEPELLPRPEPGCKLRACGPLVAGYQAGEHADRAKAQKCIGDPRPHEQRVVAAAA